MLLEAVSGSEEQSPLWQAGGKMGKKTLLRGVEIFSAAQANIRFAAKPEIVLESAVLRFLLPEGETDSSALEYRIEKLERKLAQLEQGGAAVGVSSARPAAAQAEQKKRVEPKAAQVEEPARESEPKAEIPETLPEEGEAWKAMQKYCAKNPSAKPFLSGMRPVAETRMQLTLAGGNPAMLRMFEGSDLKAEIEKMLEEQLGRKIGLQIQQESAQEELYPQDTIDIID